MRKKLDGLQKPSGIPHPAYAASPSVKEYYETKAAIPPEIHYGEVKNLGDYYEPGMTSFNGKTVAEIREILKRTYKPCQRDSGIPDKWEAWLYKASNDNGFQMAEDAVLRGGWTLKFKPPKEFVDSNSWAAQKPKEEAEEIVEFIEPVKSAYIEKSIDASHHNREDQLDGKTIGDCRAIWAKTYTLPKGVIANVTRNGGTDFWQHDSFVLQAGDYLEWVFPPPAAEGVRELKDDEIVFLDEVVNAEAVESDGPAFGRSFLRGQWVNWQTKNGTMSIRPSIIYKTEMRKTKEMGGEELGGGVKTKLIKYPEQWVQLKYKQHGVPSNAFWTTAAKCQLVDAENLSVHGTPCGTSDDEYVAVMQNDYDGTLVEGVEYKEGSSCAYPPPMESFYRHIQKEGTFQIRILPPLKDGNLFEARRQHYGINGASQCSKEMAANKWIGECPICDHYNALWEQSHKYEKTGDYTKAQELSAEARKVKPVERFYYNVIDRSNDDTAVPQIYAVGKQVHKQIIAAIIGDEAMDEEPLGDITDPVKGYDIRIIKEMKAQWPAYTVRPRMNSSILGTPEQIKNWLGDLWDLRKVCQSWHKPQDVLASLVEQEKQPYVQKVHVRECLSCSVEFEQPNDGKNRKFCDDACRADYYAPEDMTVKNVAGANGHGGPLPDNYMDQEAASMAARRKEMAKKDATLDDDDFLRELANM